MCRRAARRASAHAQRSFSVEITDRRGGTDVTFDLSAGSVNMYQVSAQDDSILRVRGGQAAGYFYLHNAQVYVKNGGSVAGYISAYGNSRLYVEDRGEFGSISAYDDTQIRVPAAPNSTAHVGGVKLRDRSSLLVDRDCTGGTWSAYASSAIHITNGAAVTLSYGLDLIDNPTFQTEPGTRLKLSELYLSGTSLDMASVQADWDISEFIVASSSQLAIHDSTLKSPCSFRVAGSCSVDLRGVTGAGAVSLDTWYGAPGSVRIMSSEFPLGFFGISGGTLTLDASTVTTGAGEDGILRMEGGAIVDVVNGSTLQITSLVCNDGTINITNHSSLQADDAVIGSDEDDPDDFAGFDGKPVVNVQSGEGFRANRLTVGAWGQPGKLVITDSGLLSTHEAVVGTGGGRLYDQYENELPWRASSGSVIIDGPQAKWIGSGQDNTVKVGVNGGNGSIEIVNGATLECENGSVGVGGCVNPDNPGEYHPSQGTVLIKDRGSEWRVSKDLQIGDRDPLLASLDKGKVTVGAETHLKVGNSLTITAGKQAEGTLRGQLVLEGGTVSAKSIDIEGVGSPDMTAGRLQGHGYLTGPGDGAQKTLTKVVNHGQITVGGAYSPVQGGVEAILWIDGEYEQPADGKLVLPVSDDNNATRAGTERIPLVISGKANFGGTLRVEYQGTTPEIGSRYHLAKFEDVIGRFQAFEGTRIAGRDDRFFGLNYVENAISGASALDLITLETPRTVGGGHLTQPSHSRLVLMTHGWNSSANVWATGMRDTIAGRVGQNWDVVSFDWEQHADVMNPTNAAEIGIDIGESLVHWMEERGIVYSDGVHLMGHSAGSWLVDAAADMIQQRHASTQIATTFFDAYVPYSNVFDKPGAPNPTADDLGGSANWAIQLFTHLGDPRTNEELANCVNVNLNKVFSGYNPVAAHGFPYVWYQTTVDQPSVQNAQDAGRILGFPSSMEWRQSKGLSILPHTGVLQRGSSLVVRDDGIYQPALFSDHQIPIVFSSQTNVPSTTGQITIDPDNSVILSTGSPVMLTSFLSLPELTNCFSFDYQFLSAADGLLSVYFDGDLLFGVDSEDLVDRLTSYRSGTIWLKEDAQPGTHTLIVRVDPNTEEQAIAKIWNLEFAHIDLIRLNTLGPALTWDGLADGAWYTSSRWTSEAGGQVPDYTTRAVVLKNHVALAENADAYSLRVEDAATLAIERAVTLSVVDGAELVNGQLRIADSGRLAVGGSLTLGSDSQLICEIGRIEDGLVSAAGEAAIEAESHLSLRAGAMLTSPGTWGSVIKTLVTAGSVSGTFATVPAVDEYLDHGVLYESMTYEPSAVKASLFQAGPGDIWNDPTEIPGVDRMVDVPDIQQILRAAKFNNGKPAVWTDGDFNDDGLVTAVDIQLVLSANLFKKGLYGACEAAATGATPNVVLRLTSEGLVIDTQGAVINGYVLSSSEGLLTGDAAENLGVFQVDSDTEISGQMFFALSGEHLLGQVTGTGLTAEQLASDLKLTYTVAGQAGTYAATLVVPEPGTIVLLVIAVLVGLSLVMRRKR